MEQEKVVKVSDWSQPYKLAVYAIVVLGFGGFVWFWVLPWMNEVLMILKTIANNTAK